jgi:aquaporin Z
MEALGLGLFMLSACACAALLEYPDSPVHRALPDPTLRRAVMGVAMGLTAIAIIYSPFGRRSGAHINPATTLAFWRLGRVRTPDALAYGVAQVAGGAAGTMLAAIVLGAWVRHPAVHYVVTHPGTWGTAVAFGAEVVISALLLSVVLRISASRFEAATGLVVGALVATYITVEAPVSGMSMNPARSLASALAAHDYDGLWIYLIAPPVGMLLAVQGFVLERGARARSTGCAKLRHDPALACIFCGREPAATRRH